MLITKLGGKIVIFTKKKLEIIVEIKIMVFNTLFVSMLIFS